MQTWSTRQLAGFLDHARSDRLYAAWHLAAMSGMRRGEVLGLRWTDVDVTTSTLAVRQTYVSIDGTPQVSEPKTAKSRRSIDLDHDTVRVLENWQNAQNKDRRDWGPAWEEHGLVFTRENGSPVHPDSFSRSFQQLAEAADLPVIRLHDLRHTTATLWLQAGVNPKIVSERLGHHSTAFTLDVYSHVLPGMQAEAAEDVARAIRAHREPPASAPPEDTDSTPRDGGS
nr:site-specific integrase [Salsipaludibacter albus]